MNSAVAVIHKLEAAGFDRRQAEAQVEAVAELMAADIATKADLQDIRTEITALRSDIDSRITALRSDMEKMEMRITIKLGAMQAVLVAVVAALVKLL